jgi:tetratricopeptide (TPR) repeat protein
MLRALREVIERPGVIPLRAGVNTGRVFTGDFGPPYRRTYVVLGDAINTAARVMGRAEAGQILSTEIVLERSRALFATTAIEPFQAKGKAELVRASVVGALAGRRVERAAETPLVGRDGELAALREVRDRVTAGEGWIVELSGVSGIGKSRLVAELVATSPDVTFLHALCEEYEASTPYFALRAPLRAALGLDLSASGGEVEARLRAVVAGADAELVPWLPLLGILLGLDLPPTPETSGLDERFLSDTLADVVARFFASALADTPLVVVVDDAQFLDEASADLLRRLSSAAASPRHALVVVHSDPSTAWTRVEDEGVPFVALTLLPLAERHALEIAELVTDENPLLPHELEEIARRSGGSPLFLLELLDLARSTGTTESLPDSVEAVIAAEIDRLRPSDRTVLRYASVLGLRFEQELLSAAVRDEVEVDEALWVRLRGLVDPDPTGGLRFRNTLLRDVAYEGLAFRRRRELHGRVAEAIETGATAAEDEASPLALHFFAAQHYEKAWRYNRLAGDRARAVAANVEAGRFYETALAAGRRLRGIGNHDRASVWVALGAVREAAGLFDPSFTALRQATRLLLDDPVECARVFALRTKARVRQGAYGLALRETTAGLRVVEDVDSAAAVGARANLRAMRSEIRWLQGHPREAIALAQEAIAEAEPVQELEALARSYTALDGAYQMLGQPEKAVHERMSLDIYTRLGHTRSRGIMELNLGVQAYADGRWDEAASLYARAQEDCLRAGDRQHTAVAGANLGELLVSRGELDEAERLLTDARRVLRSSGFTPFALFAETQLARCALERDDVPAALQSLQRIVAEAAGVGHAGIVLEITLYFAQAQARAGHGAEGLEALNAAAFHAEEDAAFLAAPLERARAACLASLGRLDDARIFLDRALRSAEDQGLLYEQLLARRALAELGGGESEEQLRETDRLAQLLGL